MKEIRQKAKELLKEHCRVCPECNGKICSGEVPGMGGLGTGSSFRANVEALAAVRFNMRTLHDVAEPKTGRNLLGLDLDMPVMAAPIGGASFNMGKDLDEYEYIHSVLAGSVDAGVIGCTGDGVPEWLYKAGYKAIRDLEGRGIPFIKPWDDAEFFMKVEEAADAGATIFGMDIDACGLITLKKMGRPVSPKTPAKLAELKKRIPGKLILKGIMTPGDARAAADAGVEAIVVSNHGGRVLDHAPGGAEVLPAVAAAVKGQLTILADGGVRSGADVLKMLALGADGVLIGRPLVWASVGGGREGVRKYWEKIKGELMSSMVLTGCGDVRSVDPKIIYQK